MCIMHRRRHKGSSTVGMESILKNRPFFLYEISTISEGSDPHFHRASHCCCTSSVMVSIHHERSHQTAYESCDRRLGMLTLGDSFSVYARRSTLSRFTLPKTPCQTNEDARRLDDLKLSNSLRHPHLIGNQTCLFNIHLIGR